MSQSILWSPSSETCLSYEVANSSFTWDEALELCKNKTPAYDEVKGRLAFILSEQQKNFLFNNTLKVENGRAWIGLRSNGTSGMKVCEEDQVSYQREWQVGDIRIPLNISLEPCFLNENQQPSCVTIAYENYNFDVFGDKA